MRTRGMTAAAAYTCALIIISLAMPALGAVTVGVNFTGTTLNETIALGTGAVPPDTQGSVGPSHYAELVNGAFAVYTKTTGALVGTRITDQQFWTNAGFNPGAGNLSDPRILYDAASGRWWALEITLSNTGNQVLLGRSNGSDPTSVSPTTSTTGWSVATFAPNATQFTDYPTLAVDGNAVYVGANLFTSSVGTFSGVEVVSVPKADLLAATPSAANRTVFSTGAVNTGTKLNGVSTPQLVSNFGTTPATTSVFTAGGGVLYGLVYRNDLSGTGAAGATLGNQAQLYSTATPTQTLAWQPDGTRVIDTIDDRFTSSIYQVGNVVYMIQIIETASSRTGLRWTKFNAQTGAVIDQGLLGDPNYDYFMGSIAANTSGDVVVGFDRSGSGAGAFISSYALIGKTTGDPLTAGSLTFTTPPMLLLAGSVDYHVLGTTPERWGDDSAMIVDPTNASIFWTIQEWPSATNRWATQITEITVPEPATLALLAFGAAFISLRGRRGNRR